MAQYGATMAHCNEKGSFVTMVSGDAYAIAALCLRSQLSLLKSSCLLTLVYDDGIFLPPLSAALLAKLEAAFGRRHMLPLSWLRSAAADTAARVANATCLHPRRERYPSLCRDAGLLGRMSDVSSAAAPRVETTYEPPNVHGRRLYATGMHALTRAKLWLWALPTTRFPRAVFLDADLLVLSNLDALFDVDLGSHALAGVSVPRDGPAGCRLSPNVFSSALFVFRPSLATLEALLQRERTYERVGQACEIKITDQSILASHLRGSCIPWPTDGHHCDGLEWKQLSPSYLVSADGFDRAKRERVEGLVAPVRAVHFAGHYGRSVKPWINVSPRIEARINASDGGWRQRWRAQCLAKR